jgi:hypothetical protein
LRSPRTSHASRHRTERSAVQAATILHSVG